MVEIMRHLVFSAIAQIILLFCALGPARGAVPYPVNSSDPVSIAFAFVTTYYDYWSRDAGSALAYFDSAYGSLIDFYGKPIGHGSLIGAKRRYLERWPIRLYTV
ncbi:MAG: hypothetical protein JO047_05800, partial [Alphaproteobacteria bacterium]|nr:hypothetical protein [Alphaproteobacteria bacterium]